MLVSIEAKSGIDAACPFFGRDGGVILPDSHRRACTRPALGPTGWPHFIKARPSRQRQCHQEVDAVTTIQAVHTAQVKMSRLYSLIRELRIPAPQRDLSGRYDWTETDLENVRKALLIDLRTKRGKEMAAHV
jgi:hypothetical protein